MVWVWLLNFVRRIIKRMCPTDGNKGSKSFSSARLEICKFKIIRLDIWSVDIERHVRIVNFRGCTRGPLFEATTAFFRNVINGFRFYSHHPRSYAVSLRISTKGVSSFRDTFPDDSFFRMDIIKLLHNNNHIRPKISYLTLSNVE